MYPITTGATRDRGAVATLATALLLVVLANCVSPENEHIEVRTQASTLHADLAFRWAPVHYQDVNKSGSVSLQGRSDYISAWDYDGNNSTTDNWDKLSSTQTPSIAYFSVTESASHFFIYYMFYHSRDWADSCFGDGEHENDGEGLLYFIRKDGSAHGLLEGIVSFAHAKFSSYSAVPYVTRGASNPESLHTIQYEFAAGFNRPRSYQEPRGHGVFVCGSRLSNCVRNDDGIRYVPSASDAAVPPLPIPNGVQVTVNYRLIDITSSAGGMFPHRHSPSTFSDWRTMRGDSSGTCGDACEITGCAPNAANVVWGWDDGRDGGGLDNTAFGTDPARFIRAYFQFGGVAAPSSSYVDNRFAFARSVCNSCAHDVCSTGAKLTTSCDWCAGKVCAADAFCCSNSWDSVCVNEAKEICAQACNPTHSLCITGAALGPGTSTAAYEICAIDPFCCENTWDDLCVAHVSDVCFRSCAADGTGW